MHHAQSVVSDLEELGMKEDHIRQALRVNDSPDWVIDEHHPKEDEISV